MGLDPLESAYGGAVPAKGASFDVEGAVVGPDGRRMRRDATMLPLDELSAQRHGTWVQGVAHIITVGGATPAGPAWFAAGLGGRCTPAHLASRRRFDSALVWSSWAPGFLPGARAAALPAGHLPPHPPPPLRPCRP